MEHPDQVVSARAAGCRHCGTPLGEADHHLHSRYDKIELPPVRPVVTRVERYAGHCSCCGGTTLAPVPDGLEEGSLLIGAQGGLWHRVGAASGESGEDAPDPVRPPCGGRAGPARPG